MPRSRVPCELALCRLVSARRDGSAAEVSRAEQLVAVAHLPFADALAMRYRNRGVDRDDLIQIARLALLQCVKRWDPERGEFLGFATPTITGSIKRYFRDQLYLIRIPRDLYEINQEADAAQVELRERHPVRPPTAGEVAARIGRSGRDFERARSARSAIQYLNVDEIQLLQPESPYDRIEKRLDLRNALLRLDRGERRLLYLYYVRSWSQAQIAGTMGVSQMQVSRLHAHIIGKLRRVLTPSC